MDWVALDRLDRTSRPGKILNLIESIPLPVSLIAGAMPAKISTPDMLADLVTRGMEISGDGTLPENSAVVEEGQ